MKYVKNLREKELTDTNNDCKAYCTGLCTTQCSGTCTDQCTSNCGGNCTGTCVGQSYVAPFSSFSSYGGGMYLQGPYTQGFSSSSSYSESVTYFSNMYFTN